MPNKKSIKDLIDCLNNLRDGIESYKSGKNRSAYKTIAVNLRVLLLDRNNRKEQPLLFKVFQSVQFHPLRSSMLSNDEETKKWRKECGLGTKGLFVIPSTIEFRSNGASDVTIFDETMSPIAMNVWLEQPLFTQEITIKQFISSVADKEAAHSDDICDKTLGTVSSVMVGTEMLHAQHMVAIGKYVYEKTLYAANNIRKK